MLAEARLSFDRALAVRAAGDDRAQALLQLAIAILGGGVLLTSFILGARVLNARGEGFLFASTGIAALMNVTAAILFVQAYSGFVPRTIAVGPTVHEMREALNVEATKQGKKDLASLLLDQYDKEFKGQETQSNGEARLRRAGIWILAFSVLMYLAGPAGAALISAIT